MSVAYLVPIMRYSITVKEWRDLAIWVCDRSSSLKMGP